ncbi:MAG: D-glycero-beta-D-manno-heptose 1-phosphate adenylyltransferase [Bacteroidetes bacterium]|nr:MAG: D-glycero-beta-D-manno-heptose 1-phosphate adenylyltransferase [Bacteroidota bacterium]
MSLFSLNSLLEEKQKWESEGERIVFTNGVFDVLHVGHLHSLESALAHGTRLIVGINSDSSVRRLNKAPDRPIHSEQDRARLLSALSCVDAVIIFESDTPLDLIIALSPHVLVKGGDYDPSCIDTANPAYIVGSKEVRAAGGTVYSVPLLPGHSTTGILKR